MRLILSITMFSVYFLSLLYLGFGAPPSAGKISRPHIMYLENNYGTPTVDKYYLKPKYVAYGHNNQFSIDIPENGHEIRYNLGNLKIGDDGTLYKPQTSLMPSFNSHILVDGDEYRVRAGDRVVHNSRTGILTITIQGRGKLALAVNMKETKDNSNTWEGIFDQTHQGRLEVFSQPAFPDLLRNGSLRLSPLR